MKNTIVVLIVLLLYLPVFAQDFVVYTQLDSYLKAEKKNHGLLICTNKQCDYKCFIELYDQQNHTGKKAISRPLTFMDGPAVYSYVPALEINKNTNTLYQRYSASFEEPSAALQILGLAAGITAGALSHYRYTGVSNPYYGTSRYLDSRAAIEASYLQSTWFQHDK